MSSGVTRFPPAGILARIIHDRLRPPLRSFPPMRRHRSSAMRRGIAVVALPRLDKRSLSRASSRSALPAVIVYEPVRRNDCPCSGRVITNNPGCPPKKSAGGRPPALVLPPSPVLLRRRLLRLGLDVALGRPGDRESVAVRV